jgi:hypothetical protein
MVRVVTGLFIWGGAVSAIKLSGAVDRTKRKTPTFWGVGSPAGAHFRWCYK